jgi:hypothetical protein
MPPSEDFHVLWLVTVLYYYLKKLREFHDLSSGWGRLVGCVRAGRQGSPRRKSWAAWLAPRRPDAHACPPDPHDDKSCPACKTAALLSRMLPACRMHLLCLHARPSMLVRVKLHAMPTDVHAGEEHPNRLRLPHTWGPLHPWRPPLHSLASCTC